MSISKLRRHPTSWLIGNTRQFLVRQILREVLFPLPLPRRHVIQVRGATAEPPLQGERTQSPAQRDSGLGVAVWRSLAREREILRKKDQVTMTGLLSRSSSVDLGDDWETRAASRQDSRAATAAVALALATFYPLVCEAFRSYSRRPCASPSAVSAQKPRTAPPPSPMAFCPHGRLTHPLGIPGQRTHLRAMEQQVEACTNLLARQMQRVR